VKITFFAGEFPYPPLYGGTADTWGRVKALSKLGQAIQLVSWVRDGARPSAAAMDHVKNRVSDAVVLTFNSSLWSQLFRLALLPCKPIFASARQMPKEGLAELDEKIAAFGPDVLWVDNFTITTLAQKYARQLGRPLVVRSQNIEHKYQEGLLSAERVGWKRLKSRVKQYGLKEYETRALNSADMFFDISLDDLAFWRDRNVGRGEWLPPIIDQNTDDLQGPATGGQELDLAYLGSLGVSTNISGLRWFYESVLPVVRVEKPDLSVVIGGSRPTAEIERIIRSDPRSVLKTNVAHPSDVWNAGRVLINPVLEGSGMNVKSAEMLFYPQPLVGTPLAVRGMPPQARQQFLIGAKPAEFAECIMKALSGEYRREGVDEARAFFDIRRAEMLVESLTDLCKARSQPARCLA